MVKTTNQKRVNKQCLVCGKEFKGPQWKNLCYACYKEEQKEKKQFDKSLKQFRLKHEKDLYEEMKRMAKKLYGYEPKY